MDLKTFITAERGRATRLAHHLGISTSYLSQMASGDSPISPERSLAIEQFSGGLVTRKETLPDRWQKIWPDLETESGVNQELSKDDAATEEQRRQVDLGYRQPADPKQVGE